MRVYTALYHAFMSPLYAGTLYQGLYQVFAKYAPLGLIPGLSHEFSSALALGAVSSGTYFFMNPVLPVCFMMAYAVALFCFMLVLCSTRSWPALAVLGASIKPAHT